MRLPICYSICNIIACTYLREINILIIISPKLNICKFVALAAWNSGHRIEMILFVASFALLLCVFVINKSKKYEISPKLYKYLFVFFFWNIAEAWQIFVFLSEISPKLDKYLFFVWNIAEAWQILFLKYRRSLTNIGFFRSCQSCASNKSRSRQLVPKKCGSIDRPTFEGRLKMFERCCVRNFGTARNLHTDGSSAEEWRENK
jgi:hypothetical protein